MVGDVTIPINPAYVANSLARLDSTFQSLGYPRSGLYIVDCVGFANALGFQDHSCDPFYLSPPFLVLEYNQTTQGALTASARSSATYFIPRPPPDKRVASATLRVFVTVISGDYSGLTLNRKSPTAVDVVSCPPLLNCDLWVTWDFTEEARALSAKGGGLLDLTLDPIPPTDLGSGDRGARYVFYPNVDYPWAHGGSDNALTLTFEGECPKELTVSVTPDAVRPRLPVTTRLTGALASAPTKATVQALVKSCPAEPDSSPASVEVRFEVRPPAPGSPDDAGHDHGARPEGAMGKLQSDSQDATTCTAVIGADGTGSCTLTYQASEVSGVETIIARADGFNDAQAQATVQVPGLVELPGDPAPSRYMLVGAPDNHAGTNDPCRPIPPTSRHFQNHFAQPGLNDAVVAIAEKMFGETGISLRVNDGSLPLGGLFDIRNNWNPPHRTHRVGLDVDIGFSGVRNGTCVPHKRIRLEAVIRRITGNDPVIESDHFHARVR